MSVLVKKKNRVGIVLIAKQKSRNMKMKIKMLNNILSVNVGL